ncbi:hypothetical protein B296_00000619 [Ensete ventricosum]|uniref:Uncharacterized protein n=1 Tax=Ensete ventricosum TaxID=4639 RepID=A0A427A8Y2_ENSVE|nr:hypothetical protein B296_00000619 [Ensete ventricosum]
MASLLSSSAALHDRSLSLTSPSAALARAGPHRAPRIRAVSSTDPQKETPAKSSTEATKTPVPTPSPTSLPKKPVYSMKKGQIVRVDKEKYLNSINVLELRIFETGEHALVSYSHSDPCFCFFIYYRNSKDILLP